MRFPLRSRGLFFLGALCLVATGHLSIPSAHASVHIGATLDDLEARSSVVALVQPVEAHSAWEKGRIYTYTRVRMERVLAGDGPPASDLWIRTMGGEVGTLGQRVEGEAVFTLGHKEVLFLHGGPPGLFELTARAQGQFPLTQEEGQPEKLMASSAVGVVIPPAAQGPAVCGPMAPDAPTQPTPSFVAAAQTLQGKTVEEAARIIAERWARNHPRRYP